MHFVLLALAFFGFASIFPRLFNAVYFMILLAMAATLTVAAAVTLSFVSGGSIPSAACWIVGAAVGVPMAYALWAN